MSIVTTAIEIGSTIGSLFADKRHALTSQDWDNLIPFSGNIYSALRSRMPATIKYSEDLANFPTFTLYQLYELGWETTGDRLAEAIKEMRAERIKCNKPYVPTKIFPRNKSLQYSHLSYEEDYIDHFEGYFYGTIADEGNDGEGFDTTPAGDTSSTQKQTAVDNVTPDKTTTAKNVTEDIIGKNSGKTKTENDNTMLYVFGFALLAIIAYKFL